MMPSLSAIFAITLTFLAIIGDLYKIGAPRPTVERVSYQTENVTFNRPKLLYVGESTEVQAVVDAKELSETVKNDLFGNLQGDVLVKSIQARKFLSAKLTADPYLVSITPKDEFLRQASTDERIIWTWYLRPLRVGNISITLDVFSQDDATSGSPVSEARVLHETWTADARGWEWVKYQVAEIHPVYAALTAIAGGIAALIGIFLKRRKALKKKPEP